MVDDTGILMDIPDLVNVDIATKKHQVRAGYIH